MKPPKWPGFICLALMTTFAIYGCDKDDDDDDNHNLSAMDRDFMRKAAYANRAEIELGQLATEKGNHDAVQDFGQHMVIEHTQALRELDSLADRWDVDLPDGLDSLHQAKKQLLSTYAGYAFDTAYIKGQVMDHIEALNLFQQEASNGQEPRLKAYANKYIPHIQMHKNKADSINNLLH